MSDKTYMTVSGVIEYDPEQRDANGKQVTQFTLRVSGQKDLRVTVWPELKIPAGLLKKGLLAGVRGTYSPSEKDGKVYHNLSAQSVSVGADVFVKDAPATTQRPADNEAAF